MKRQKLFMIVGVLFVFGVTLALPVGPALAQSKEICNDGVDNDGDKAIDCADADCATSDFCKTPPPKTGNCSPGFYKNHLTFWVGIYCDDITTDPTCSELLEALTCKGSDATCGRSAAAAYLNSLSGCSE
jgi:hypothetical protein